MSTQGYKNGVIGAKDICLDGTTIAQYKNDRSTSPSRDENQPLISKKLSIGILNEL